MTGRSIRIYLADGTPGGIRVTQIPGWTGRVVVCPASELRRAKEIEPNLIGPGIYFLVGDDPERDGRKLVYVGESESVIARVGNHIQKGEKEFQFAVMVVATDDFLTKGHIGWLEREFIRICTEAGAATIDNDNKGRATSLPRADQDDMRRFIQDIRMVLPVLGFSFASEVADVPVAASTTGEEQAASPIFEINRVGATATMQIRDGDYVVFKGSTARVQATSSWTSFRGFRDQLVKDGKLQLSDDPEFYVFTESIAFNSPSAAAAVVVARNTNGRTDWLMRDTRQTLGAWQEERAGFEGEEDEGLGTE